jgi:hypothetical protein
VLRLFAAERGIALASALPSAPRSGTTAPDALERGRGRRGKIEWVFLQHDRNGGKGTAIQTALSQATGAISIIHNADLEYHPRDVLRIVKVFEKEGADAVFGSRFAGGEARRVLLFRHDAWKAAADVRHEPRKQCERHRHACKLPRLAPLGETASSTWQRQGHGTPEVRLVAEEVAVPGVRRGELPSNVDRSREQHLAHARGELRVVTVLLAGERVDRLEVVELVPPHALEEPADPALRAEDVEGDPLRVGAGADRGTQHLAAVRVAEIRAVQVPARHPTARVRQPRLLQVDHLDVQPQEALRAQRKDLLQTEDVPLRPVEVLDEPVDRPVVVLASRAPSSRFRSPTRAFPRPATR